MKIAVTSQNFKTVTNHAGKARRFIVYQVETDQEPQEIDRIDLPKDMSLSAFTGTAHPIDTVDVVISASFGPGFARRMHAKNIQASLTTQSDPLAAVKEFCQNGPTLPAPHQNDDEDGCGCSCGDHTH